MFPALGLSSSCGSRFVLGKVAAGLFLVLASAPIFAAGEIVEYEGRFRFGIGQSDGRPDYSPLVRVITLDDEVQQITVLDTGTADQIQVFNLKASKLVRYSISPAAHGKPAKVYDLATDRTLTKEERERINALVKLHLRHFASYTYKRLPAIQSAPRTR